MLGLLLAFTFHGAASRFDERRHLVVDESNAIGTAYLRLDLLPSSVRNEAQDLFRQYVDERLATYSNWLDDQTRDQRSQAAQQIQNRIWALTIASIEKGASSQVGILLLPALNQMFDIANTRMMYVRIHPPMIIYLLLTAIALLCATIAGHSMARYPVRNWLHILGFSFMLALIFYVIIDIEYPRAGFIRLNDIDQTLLDLRQSMK